MARSKDTTVYYCGHCDTSFTQPRPDRQKRFCSPTCRNRARVIPAQQRFIAKVTKQPNGCWEWNGAKCGNGYGNFFNGSVVVMSHRFSYQMHVGEIPDGLWVLHTCDNPPCCNPAHLFLGTPQDNSDDMINKGRKHYPPTKPKPVPTAPYANAKRGTDHHAAKLTPDIVRQIRDRLNDGMSLRRVGLEFGVSATVVHRIAHNRGWKQVA